MIRIYIVHIEQDQRFKEQMNIFKCINKDEEDENGGEDKQK